MCDKDGYLAVFDVPGRMRFAFFALPLNSRLLLGPGAKLALTSEALSPDSCAALLAFEDNDE